MKKRLYLTASAFALLAACDNSTGSNVAGADNSSANGSSIAWDVIQYDSIISVTNNTFVRRQFEWEYNYQSGKNVLSGTDYTYPYEISGDTLYIHVSNEWMKHARISGTNGSVYGRWKRLFDTRNDTAETFSPNKRKRFDSLIAIGRDYFNKSGWITEIEITQTGYHEKVIKGKPAYAKMAYEYSPYNCAGVSWANGPCSHALKDSVYKYSPSIVSDSIFAYNFPLKNETVYLKFAPGVNNNYFNYTAGTYTSSNKERTPVVTTGDYDTDHAIWLNSWLGQVFSN